MVNKERRKHKKEAKIRDFLETNFDSIHDRITNLDEQTESLQQTIENFYLRENGRHGGPSPAKIINLLYAKRRLEAVKSLGLSDANLVGKEVTMHLRSGRGASATNGIRRSMGDDLCLF